MREICLNTGKYGPEKTPHLDIFHTVLLVNENEKRSSYLNCSSSLLDESKLVNDIMKFLPHIYTKMHAWIGLS